MACVARRRRCVRARDAAWRVHGAHSAAVAGDRKIKLPVRILVADDDPKLLESHRGALAHNGHDVPTAPKPIEEFAALSPASRAWVSDPADERVGPRAAWWSRSRPSVPRWTPTRSR